MDWQRLILVVEDDDATRTFLLDNLAADGFRVAGASGAGEGLWAVEVRQPALVILDLILEDGSGLDLLDRVRVADGLASRLDPDLPVIVLTGRSGEADRVRSFARGAGDHVSKPMCRLPQHAIPVVHRARDSSGVWRPPLQARAVCGRKIRRRQSAAPMVSAVDTTRPSRRLIIRATSCNGADRRRHEPQTSCYRLKTSGPSFRARLLASQARRPSGRPQTRSAF